jgi:VWFA-related protein
MIPVVRSALGVVLALAGVGLTAAQQLQQPVPEQQPVANAGGYTFHATSKLVVLDVVVTDKAGRVVNDLTQEDFEVLENKETQKIGSFERPALRVPPTNVTISSTQDLDHFAPQAPVNIIVLDEFNSSFNEMTYARDAVKKYLGKQQAKLEQPTMLVAVALGHFEVLHDYTQDRDALEKAVDHHLAEYPWQNKQRSWFSKQYGTAFAALMQLAEASS